ncbi:MAG: hypothetical protein KatS3mg131_2089 [Candidatus Tectimicrobiota bacterium]|nr:MAG: hypothetical protein KatS3mg131_2089 [Candidatus Tectomicrobia bacterium]
MFAIEFQATVKEGMIEIPRQYLGKITNRVRVILLVEEAPETTTTFIDQLLAHPVRVKGFRPLSREEIYAR